MFSCTVPASTTEAGGPPQPQLVMATHSPRLAREKVSRLPYTTSPLLLPQLLFKLTAMAIRRKIKKKVKLVLDCFVDRGKVYFTGLLTVYEV